MDKRERDYSIDFVKGVAILFVILLHNMPNESIYSIAYIGQAVPLFLLVSSYLTYGGFQRKGFNGYFSARNVKKMLDRVFLPFFLLIFSQCAIFYLLKGGVDWQRLYMQGGFGPGSYYPWIYLQCWLILPFVIFLVNCLSFRTVPDLKACQYLIPVVRIEIRDRKGAINGLPHYGRTHVYTFQRHGKIPADKFQFVVARQQKDQSAQGGN